MTVSYADADSVTTLLTTLGVQPSDLKLQQALGYADERIKNKVQRIELPHPVPSVILQAANLIAAAIVVEGASMMNDHLSGTSTAWKKDAYGMIAEYLAAHPEDRKGVKISFNTVSGPVKDTTVPDQGANPFYPY